MDAEHVISQIQRELDAEVIYQNRKLKMWTLEQLKSEIPSVSSTHSENGFQYVTVDGRTLRFGNAATLEHIKQAFTNSPQVTMSSFTGYQPGMIQAKLNDLRQKATDRRNAAFGKLDAAHTKLAGVDAEIEKVASQIDKEADLALHEFAQFSNGAPE